MNNLYTEDQLLLSKPYYCYLSELDRKLLPLHFIDYHKFCCKKESWIPYHEREPGCIEDFYNSVLMLLKKKENIFPLTLDFIKELYSNLSCSNYFLKNKDTAKKHKKAHHHKGFNLLAINVTKAGLIELIHRIKKDNVTTGFVLVDADNIKVLDDKNFDDYEESLEADDIDILDDKDLNDYDKALEKVRKAADIHLEAVRYLSSKQIDELAERYLKDILNKKNKWLLPPIPEYAMRQAEVAIEQFNIEIEACKTTAESIRICVKLIHELEILHLFYDVNCRTNCLLLKVLLISCGIKPPVFYEPNCIDLFSINEIVQEVKVGIYRFDYIQNNQEMYLKQHKILCEKDKNFFRSIAEFSNPNEYLDHISQPLVEELAYLKQQYYEKINELEKLLKARLSKKEKIIYSYLYCFFSKKSRSDYETLNRLEEILAEFKLTYHAINFFQQIESINHLISLISPNTFRQAWNEKIQELKYLSGLNTALTLDGFITTPLTLG